MLFSSTLKIEATHNWRMLATLPRSTWCKDARAELTSTMNNNRKIKTCSMISLT
jgi:hypothetical protein